MTGHGHEVSFGYFLIPNAADPLVSTAQEVERLGLDYIGVQDHPYQRRFVDTWTLLSMIAATTERVRVFPDVACLPLRPPAVLAKAAASLDLLSGGRVELGLGAGAFWDAVEGYGGPRRGPGEALAALAEAIQVIRKVWSGERNLRFEGEHYRLAGCTGPLPAHPIGIWLGVNGPRAPRLAGQVADGWVPSFRGDLRVLRDRSGWTRARPKRDATRRAAPVLNVGGVITDGASEGMLRGPTAQWVDELTTLVVEHGFDTFILWTDARTAAALRRGGRPRGPGPGGQGAPTTELTAPGHAHLPPRRLALVLQPGRRRFLPTVGVTLLQRRSSRSALGQLSDDLRRRGDLGDLADALAGYRAMAATVPVTARLGVRADSRGNGSGRGPAWSTPTTSPWNASAAWSAERSTAGGAFGQPTANASVSTVASSSAPSSAATYSGWRPTPEGRNRVPTRTPAAPAPSTAAIEAPAIPPAVSTGTVTTSSTPVSSGSSASRAAHVPARLHPLGDNQVAAGVGGALGLADRADLPAGQRPTGMHQLDQGGSGSAQKNSTSRARLAASSISARPGCGGTGEVDAERSCRPAGAGRYGRPGSAGALQHAQPAGRADRDGQLRGHHPTAHGANWIGTWQPTSSVKAVRNMPRSMAPGQVPEPWTMT